MLPNTSGRVNFLVIQQAVALALKHIRLVVLLMTLGFAAGLFYYVYARPVYLTQALVEVDITDLPIDTQKAFGDSSPFHIAMAMSSPDVIARAAERLGIDASYGTIMQEHIKQVAVLNGYTATDTTLAVQVYAYRRDGLERWPRALFEAFLEVRDEKREQILQETLDTHLREIARLDTLIRDQQTRIRDFSNSKNYRETQRQIRELSRAEAQLTEVNVTIQAYEEARRILTSKDLTPEEILSLLSGLEESLDIGVSINEYSYDTNIRIEGLPSSDAVSAGSGDGKPRQITTSDDLKTLRPEEYRKLKISYEEAKATFDEVAAVYREAHPKYKEAADALAVAKDELFGSFAGLERRFALEYEYLLTLRRKYVDQLALLDAAEARMLTLESELASLRSEGRSWVGLRSQLTYKLEQLQYGAENERAAITFLGLSSVGRYPVSPSRRKILLISLLLGFGLSFAVPFMVEFLDHTVSEPDTLERDLGVQPLGIIPRYSDSPAIASAGSQQSVGKISGEQSADSLRLETFRVIRANFMSNRSITQNRQVIMMTSALPREGKSHSSWSLALSFANSGERTLLLDADVRRGRQHRRFGVSARPGFSDAVAAGRTDATTFCRPTEYANLDILPCGTRTSRFPEILSTETMANFMANLREQYTRIIVDCPPALGLAESHFLLPHVDGVMLVIWSANTSRKAVEDAVHLMAMNGANFFGFLLNQVDMKDATNYHRFYYYSQYYYTSYAPAQDDQEVDEDLAEELEKEPGDASSKST